MQTDILVAGTGPAGLIAALALAGAGFAPVLAGPPVRADDRRTTTIMEPGLAFLDRVGIGQPLREAGAPLAAMRIVDMTGRLIRSPTVTFRAQEVGSAAFGYNIPNAILNATLAKAVETAPIHRFEAEVAHWRIDTEAVLATIATGEAIAAKLAVAADGRLSPAREAAGITVRRSTLPQSALVLSFAHERPHENISTEFHTPHGPFTQVPLPGINRSSLVWVTAPEEAARLEQLGDEALALEAERMMQSMLGRLTLDPGRQVWPLSIAMPSRFGGNRVALVGEAAHVFPPIGAQGLNLGIRDVADLVAALETSPDDPGSDSALARYDRLRRPDILARSEAVNALNRSLLSAHLPAQLARSAGLGLLRSFGPLRNLFMREGMAPGSGLGAIAQGLREQVGRKVSAGDQDQETGHRRH